MLNLHLELNEGIFHKDVERASTREGFGEGILRAGKVNKDIVALTADLASSLKLTEFIKKYPERFIQVGIAEQNMVGIASGLALGGKIPFITSYAIFNPGRNWEQIRLSVCLSNLNVKIVGSHSGLSHGRDGGVAQMLEDIALTRVLPNMVVINPIDYDEAIKATLAAAKYKGPVYLRLTREQTPKITTTETPFKIGDALVLKEGTDISIFATGPITYEALVASKELQAKYKIKSEVISFSTIKPLDEKTILESSKKTGKVLTLEEHQIAAGFGSAVAEYLSENNNVPVMRMGINNSFGESGDYGDLKDKFKLSSHHIENKVLEFLKK